MNTYVYEKLDDGCMYNCRSDNYSYRFESHVRGYHVYQLSQMKGWFWTMDRGYQEDVEY